MADFKARGGMKANDDRLRDAAFHEAGHVIVARELGLPVGEIAIEIDGDEAKGRSDFGVGASSSVDRSDRSVCRWRCRAIVI